ncbi:Stress-associated endoplasmic reticulum protein 1 [Sciurus carolinensis]|uniref:Stress-associated endoplasmic reticulum protein n=1 Tax=Sciurus carolinensis TaxID=30640 RepID=A0AA41MVI0_SCICA|nr:Stress-associated endoplasmic reticulum protein 1 [Sciurus carolinensis]
MVGKQRIQLAKKHGKNRISCSAGGPKSSQNVPEGKTTVRPWLLTLFIYFSVRGSSIFQIIQSVRKGM